MKKLTILCLMAALIGFVFVDASSAADPNRPQRPRFDPNAIRGKVIVEKDAEGAISSVKIENRRFGNWNVVLDDNGKKLAEEMENKPVIVKGTVETKDGEKWVTVESYTEMKRPDRPRGPGDPNRPRPPKPRAPGGPEEGGQ